jgi:5-methylthioribose kinase
MAYSQLSTDTVVDYLKSVKGVRFPFDDFDNLEVKEIGDGNLNFVYSLTDKGDASRSVVLKQAVPFLRCVGESWPLPKERMHLEIMALELGAAQCPNHVPKVYYGDMEMCLVIMQNLNRHRVLRGEIIEGKIFPKFADHMSTFLAKTLFATSDLGLDHRTKKEMVKKFINIDLCKITEDLVFTYPYEKNETNEYNPELPQSEIDKIQKNSELKIAVAQMKYAFMTSTQALLHGDLHIGSIMVNKEETIVFDPEFAFFGPMGFDIGALIGNLFMAYFSHSYRQVMLGNEPYVYRRWLLDVVEEIWTGFAEKFDHLWKHQMAKSDSLQWQHDKSGEGAASLRQKFIHRIFIDTIGFAACKMMRRILGLAKVADIADIEDLKERAKIEIMTLAMARKMVIERESFSDIQQLIDLAKEISPLI